MFTDLDPEPIVSIWGEVNANRHRALGCVGTLTHGAVRDIDKHWVDFGRPVVVAGLTISSGDGADLYHCTVVTVGDDPAVEPKSLRRRV